MAFVLLESDFRSLLRDGLEQIGGAFLLPPHDNLALSILARLSIRAVSSLIIVALLKALSIGNFQTGYAMKPNQIVTITSYILIVIFILVVLKEIWMRSRGERRWIGNKVNKLI